MTKYQFAIRSQVTGNLTNPIMTLDSAKECIERAQRWAMFGDNLRPLWNIGFYIDSVPVTYAQMCEHVHKDLDAKQGSYGSLPERTKAAHRLTAYTLRKINAQDDIENEREKADPDTELIAYLNREISGLNIRINDLNNIYGFFTPEGGN